jgi:hypothetical protein
MKFGAHLQLPGCGSTQNTLTQITFELQMTPFHAFFENRLVIREAA